MTYLYDPFNKPPGSHRDHVHISVKQQEADALRAEVEAFVAAGGVIEKLSVDAGRKPQLGKTRQQMTRAERARESKKRLAETRLRLSKNAPQFDDEEE